MGSVKESRLKWNNSIHTARVNIIRANYYCTYTLLFKSAIVLNEHFFQDLDQHFNKSFGTSDTRSK